LFPIKRFDGLKVRANVMGNDCYKWHECLKVLTKVSAKGVSKGENCVSLFPLVAGDSQEVWTWNTSCAPHA